MGAAAATAPLHTLIVVVMEAEGRQGVTALKFETVARLGNAKFQGSNLA